MTAIISLVHKIFAAMKIQLANTNPIFFSSTTKCLEKYLRELIDINTIQPALTGVPTDVGWLHKAMSQRELM